MKPCVDYLAQILISIDAALLSCQAQKVRLHSYRVQATGILVSGLIQGSF